MLLTTVPETSTILWELDNVLVLGHRVHEADSSLVDVMIEAVADDDDPDWDVPPPGDANLVVVTRDEVASSVADTEGVFVPRPPAAPRPLRLIGCQPRGPMTSAVGTGHGNPIDLVHLNRRGEPSTGYELQLDIMDVRPSVVGSGLVDLTLRGHTRELPAAEAIRQCGSTEVPTCPTCGHHWTPRRARCG